MNELKIEIKKVWDFLKSTGPQFVLKPQSPIFIIFLFNSQADCLPTIIKLQTLNMITYFLEIEKQDISFAVICVSFLSFFLNFIYSLLYWRRHVDSVAST